MIADPDKSRAWLERSRPVLSALLFGGACVAWADAPAYDSQAVAPIGGEPLSLAATVESPPLGLPKMDVPADNPITEAKISLGRKLFYDRRLSFNGTLSCAMCHVPEQGFTQNEMRTSVGMEGSFVKRNAPALYNVGYRQRLFHDGREFSLENQVWQPLLKANEMANPSVGFVIERLERAADYQGLFEAAFRRGPGIETIGQALASYQRGLVSAASSFDRWYFGGQAQLLGESARRGFALFTSVGCSACHTIHKDHALFSDGQFHDTGIGYARAMLSPDPVAARVRLAPGVEVVPRVSFARPPANDLGRYEATGHAADRWKYLTPSLRNIALTAPYMHDGSLPDLASVLRFYNKGGFAHSDLDPLLRPLDLSGLQLRDLENFLRALTGDNVEHLARDGRSTVIGDTGKEEESAAPGDAF
jgi:cytochrome c peroxidase